MTSAGKNLGTLKSFQSPLQIVGTINAYQALQSNKVGHKSYFTYGGELQMLLMVYQI